MLYVGADGHKDSVTFCAMSDAGKVKGIFELPATPAGMDELIERMNKQKKWRVMFETSTYTTDLHLYLLSKGVQSDSANPHSLRVIGTSRKKTDKNDAIAIARYLRLWARGELELSISHIVSGDGQKLRDLCRLREEFATEKGKEAQKIAAHMRRNGEYMDEVRYPNLTADKALNHILETFSDDFVLCERVKSYVYLSARCGAIDAELEKAIVYKDEVELLSSIPGIGSLTAIQLMSMIGDIDRFPTQGGFRSYFGMAPSVRDSGGTQHHGHITKRGDKMMRRILYRSIFTHMRFCPGGRIKKYYDSAVNRMGKPKARTAAANKLLDVIYAILKRRAPFHC